MKTLNTLKDYKLAANNNFQEDIIEYLEECGYEDDDIISDIQIQAIQEDKFTFPEIARMSEGTTGTVESYWNEDDIGFYEIDIPDDFETLEEYEIALLYAEPLLKITSDNISHLLIKSKNGTTFLRTRHEDGYKILFMELDQDTLNEISELNAYDIASASWLNNYVYSREWDEFS